jgi:hypothetical protein
LATVLDSDKPMFEDKKLAALEQSLAAIQATLTAQGATLKQILDFVSTNSNLQGEINKIMLDISALTAAVANETTVDASVESLLVQLTSSITNLIAQSGNSVDPVALAALVTTMQNNAANLGQAVVTNTPAATPSTPTPAAVVANVSKS